MTLKEIKSIRIISFANILALLYAGLGFLLGAGIYCYFLIKSLFRTDLLVVSWWQWCFNFLYVLALGILVACFSAVLGWFLGLLIAFFYNFFANLIGGIKIECEEKNNKNKIFNF